MASNLLTAEMSEATAEIAAAFAQFHRLTRTWIGA